MTPLALEQKKMKIYIDIKISNDPQFLSNDAQLLSNDSQMSLWWTHNAGQGSMAALGKDVIDSRINATTWGEQGLFGDWLTLVTHCYD